MEREIKIIQTKEGNYTLQINNVLIHSKYSPSSEADRFVDSNLEKIKGKKNILVYGIGLGYHLKSMLNITDADCHIFAFDADMEVVKKCEELKLLEELKSNKRIHLYLGYNKKFLIELSQKMDLVEDIIIYKPSLRTLPSEYEELINLLNSYELAKIAINRFGSMMLENYRENLNEKCMHMGEFFIKQKFNDKPIVIAAGGPSLEDNIEKLKVFREHIYIFSLGRTIDFLMKNNIKPDIITIIDPQEIVYEQIKDYLDLDIPLCFLSTASNKAVKNYKGPKYIFFNEIENNNKENIIINTGKSVSVAALDIAVKFNGEKVVFVGQDLAFLYNKFHAGDTIKESDAKKLEAFKKVQGVNGEMFETTTGMLEFKRNIEIIIDNNPDIQFINCSNGARIKGTKEMKFEEIFI